MSGDRRTVATGVSAVAGVMGRRACVGTAVLPVRLRSELSGSGWAARPFRLFDGTGFTPSSDRGHEALRPEREWVPRSCPECVFDGAFQPRAGFGVRLKRVYLSAQSIGTG
jgi:hypothetical protein